MELTMGLLLVTLGGLAIIIGVRGRGIQAFDVLTASGPVKPAPTGGPITGLVQRPARGATTGTAGPVQKRAI